MASAGTKRKLSVTRTPIRTNRQIPNITPVANSLGEQSKPSSNRSGAEKESCEGREQENEQSCTPSASQAPFRESQLRRCGLHNGSFSYCLSSVKARIDKKHRSSGCSKSSGRHRVAITFDERGGSTDFRGVPLVRYRQIPRWQHIRVNLIPGGNHEPASGWLLTQGFVVVEVELSIQRDRICH